MGFGFLWILYSISVSTERVWQILADCLSCALVALSSQLNIALLPFEQSSENERETSEC